MDRVVRLFGRVSAAAAVALAVGACDHPEIEKQRIKLGGWTQERMLADGWLKAPPEPVTPAYCYHTLGDADCYAEPESGQAMRRTVPDPTPAEPPAAKPPAAKPVSHE